MAVDLIRIIFNKLETLILLIFLRYQAPAGGLFGSTPAGAPGKLCSVYESYFLITFPKTLGWIPLHSTSAPATGSLFGSTPAGAPGKFVNLFCLIVYDDWPNIFRHLDLKPLLQVVYLAQLLLQQPLLHLEVSLGVSQLVCLEISLFDTS